MQYTYRAQLHIPRLNGYAWLPLLIAWKHTHVIYIYIYIILHDSYFKPRTKKILLIEDVKFKTIFMNNSPLRIVQVNDDVVVGSHIIIIQCEFHYNNECVYTPAYPLDLTHFIVHEPTAGVLLQSQAHIHTRIIPQICYINIFFFLSFMTRHYRSQRGPPWEADTSLDVHCYEKKDSF